jgi:Na+(H+)/acetate symporter ActP
LISVIYLLPQMKGAGISFREATGAPYWVGVAIVATVVGGNVAIGGMRGVTVVQAMQYVIKLAALAIAATVLWIATAFDAGPSVFADGPARLQREHRFAFTRSAVLRVDQPMVIDIDGVVDGELQRGQVTLKPGVHGFEPGSLVLLPAGAPVPVVGDGYQLGERWREPLQEAPRRTHPTYLTISIIVATVFGTMGLPHIVTRFYTNPDGRAARRTIVVVVFLLGLYYVWPVVLGVLGRRWAGDLLASGGTDAVVLMLPERVLGKGLGASLLTGLLAGGAFAAFLSTSSGLIVAMAGAISHDLSRSSGGLGGVRRFRWAAGGSALVVALLGLGVERFEINVLVGWAFAIAASSFCPLVVLGVWWRRFTGVGAACGLLVGGGGAVAAVVATVVGVFGGGSWPAALCSQPAAWSVPLGFLAAIVGSLLTQRTVPLGTVALLSRMHTPEPNAF